MIQDKVKYLGHYLENSELIRASRIDDAFKNKELIKMQDLLDNDEVENKTLFSFTL